MPAAIRLGAGLLILFLSFVPVAKAQSNDAGEKLAAQQQSARQLGTRALQAFDQGAYDKAVQLLTEAIAFHDAPTLRLYRARAHGRLGHWVAAVRDYDAILRSTATSGESAVTAEAREVATRESAEAYAHTAKLSLTASGLTRPVVRIDGVMWPEAQLLMTREIDPGTHILEVGRPAGEPLQVALTLAEGESLTFSLDALQTLRRSRPEPSRARLQPIRGNSAAPARKASAQVAVTPAADRRQAEDTFRLAVALYGSVSRTIDFTGPLDILDEEVSPFVGRFSAWLFPLTGELRDWLGLTVSWESGLSSTRASHSDYAVGLRARRRAGPLVFGAQVAMSRLASERTSFDAAYLAVEPSLDMSWRLGDLSLNAAVVVPLPLSYGDLALAYPDMSGYGLEGTLGLEYRLWRWLGAELSGSIRRFDLELGTVVSPLDRTSGPGSVVDTYSSLYLNLTVNL